MNDEFYSDLVFFSRTFFILLGILRICLLFTIIKNAVFATSFTYNRSSLCNVAVIAVPD